jgi:dipeptidase E
VSVTSRATPGVIASSAMRLAAFPGLHLTAAPPHSKRGTLKLLLTSGGITNPSIHDALLDLLDRPIAECRALCIPTAQWGHPRCGPESVRGFVVGGPPWLMTDMGWKSVGLLELTALPSIGAERWVPWVREADVLLVDGGEATYLCHWMRQSGLADLLPSLPDKVWVGLSAGSMVMTPRIGEDFVSWKPPTGGDSTLGIVDFSIFPHLGHELMPDNTMEAAERWAADLGGPAYAMDDQSAITVVDGTVEVVSEGQWRHFPA